MEPEPNCVANATVPSLELTKKWQDRPASKTFLRPTTALVTDFDCSRNQSRTSNYWRAASSMVRILRRTAITAIAACETLAEPVYSITTPTNWETSRSSGRSSQYDPKNESPAGGKRGFLMGL
jgi:hypothetical protein